MEAFPKERIESVRPTLSFCFFTVRYSLLYHSPRKMVGELNGGVLFLNLVFIFFIFFFSLFLASFLS